MEFGVAPPVAAQNVTAGSSLGERLRLARQRSGLSLAAVAQRAEVSKSFLWEVENDRTNIAAHRLTRIADVVGASLEYLLRGGPCPDDAQPTRIPRELGELAEGLCLPYSHTVTLLEINTILDTARGRGAGRRRMLRQDWERLYQGVKVFLDDTRSCVPAGK